MIKFSPKKLNEILRLAAEPDPAALPAMPEMTMPDLSALPPMDMGGAATPAGDPIKELKEKLEGALNKVTKDTDLETETENISD